MLSRKAYASGRYWAFLSTCLYVLAQFGDGLLTKSKKDISLTESSCPGLALEMLDGE